MRVGGLVVCAIVVLTTPQVKQYSTFSGIVQATYFDGTSYITFTNGETYYGNLSNVTNLALGRACTLNTTTGFIGVAYSSIFIRGNCTN